METDLHRQLKELYAGDATCREVWVDGYRIDALVGDELVEIQQASLGALRHKVLALLEHHRVTVVKPLVARKQLVWHSRRNGPEIERRWSPTHHSVLHLFDDLVHFVAAFPRPGLTLEVVLTEQEEHRVRKKRRRFRGPDFSVISRRLIGIVDRVRLSSQSDLANLLPKGLEFPCTTAEIAGSAEIPRWLAQKMAYCLRHADVLKQQGKRGNSWLYSRAALPRPRKAA
jgi:hypothetical protein